MNTTLFYQSKTNIAALLLPIIVALIPGVKPWASANPIAAASAVSLLMLGLRAVTNTALAWFKPKGTPVAPSATAHIQTPIQIQEPKP